MPKQSGKEAAEGWCCLAGLAGAAERQEGSTAWVNKYKSKFKREPTNYAITAYNGVKVIADAIERTVKANKPLTRSNLRDAIQATNLNTIQGADRVRRERRHH